MVMSRLKPLFAVCAGLLLSCACAHGQTLQRITITVVDENGVGIVDALVLLSGSSGSPVLQCRTGPTGACTLAVSRTDQYKIRVEKANFYASETSGVQFDKATIFEVALAGEREVREIVNVAESPPSIDPEQISSQAQLSGVDVIDLPYPTTRDYRNVLNYIPQVINDIYYQPHITGAETYQALVLFDGFNVTQPANGQLLLRVSTDSFRSINVETSRISAEYGKGSGGVIQLNTATGDDHYRFAATDFVPSVQNVNGIALDKVTPRLTVSGPISRGHAWFYDAFDGEYDNVIIKGLPSNADHDVLWRGGNLIKVQGNPSSRNIITASFNSTFGHDQHAGLSGQDPQESTPITGNSIYLGSLKEQYYFPSGQLIDSGFSFNRYNLDQTPRGTDPYFINPNAAGGSYYFTAHTQADRWQIYGNLFLKPVNWHGNHQFKAGVDLDRLRYDFNFLRQPISYLSMVPQPAEIIPPTCAPQIETPPCSRYSQFSGPSSGERYNAELSGYAQDRWLVNSRFLIEAGVRFDWDEIIRGNVFSPRLAATWVLSQAANTKFSAGVGVFHDATPIFLITRPQAGMRSDFFYSPMGALISGPVTSVFSLAPSAIESPRYLNWSIGLEQKLPGRIYLKAEFIDKRSSNGFDYTWINPVSLGPPGVQNYTAQFQLQNARHDQFDSVEVNLRRVFEQGHMIMGSYIRSRAHSDQVLDLNVDNPVFSTQQPGPYPWDAPNRFLSWGFLPLPSLPLIHRLDFGYSAEYRTGFPFYVINNQQQFATPFSDTQIATPYFLRFPQYFTLNTHVEKRFHALGFYWALRGGFDNITGRRNWWFVNNDVDSPQFLTYNGYSGRAFTARIRLLGRK